MTERRFRHDPEEMWWLPEARCIGVDPELFFPVGSSEPAMAQVNTARPVARRDMETRSIRTTVLDGRSHSF